MNSSHQPPGARSNLRAMPNSCSLAEALARLSPDAAARRAVAYGMTSGSPAPLVEAAVLMISAARRARRTSPDWQLLRESLARSDLAEVIELMLKARSLDRERRRAAVRGQN